MVISKRIEDLLNAQFTREMYSVNLYLSITSYFADLQLDGFANFFRIQAQEEMQHAMKQFDYVHTVDGKVTISAIAAPQTAFASIKDAFEVSLKHEQEVTRRIHEIVKAAIEESDFATQSFLQWFVTEQVEEESLIKNIIRKLEMVSDNSSAMYLLNEELARRKTPPAETAAPKP